MLSLIFRPALFVAFVSVVGCGSDDWSPFGSTSGKGESPSHHYTGSNNGSSRFQWYDAKPEHLDTYRDTVLPNGCKKLDDSNHKLFALQQRLQAYADRMDKYRRDRDPEGLANAPHPEVIICEQPEFLNAWASGVPVCVNAPVRFAPSQGQANGRTYASALLHHASVEPLEARTPSIMGRPPRDLEACVEAANPKISGDEVAKFAAWINERGGPCQYTWNSEEGVLEITNKENAHCQVNKNYDNDFVGADAGRYYAVIPQVFITTGFLDLISHKMGFEPGKDEAAIVGVIAHELSHFYMSHATNAEFFLTKNIFEGDGTESYDPSYNYFYTQTNPPSATKPTPRSNSRQILDQVLKYKGNQSNPFKALSGPRPLDPTLAPFILRLVSSQEVQEAISCPEATDLLQANALYNSGFIKQLTDEQKTGYRQLESKFLACAASATVAPALLEKSFTTPMKLHLSGPLPEGSLAEVLTSLNAQMKVYSVAEEKFYQSMLNERIGYYTAEQEADDMATELLAHVGLDPQAHALLDLKSGRYREKEAPEHFARVNRIPGQREDQSGMDRCEELYHADWIDASGDYQFIPIGDLVGIHHGSCYRAFNAKREIVAHQAEYAVLADPPTFDLPWAHHRALIALP